MRDPDERVKHVDNILDYYHAQGVVKFKLFALTLKGGVMSQFSTLQDKNMDSWKKLCDYFTAQLTA